MRIWLKIKDVLFRCKTAESPARLENGLWQPFWVLLMNKVVGGILRKTCISKFNFYALLII